MNKHTIAFVGIVAFGGFASMLGHHLGMPLWACGVMAFAIGWFGASATRALWGAE